MNEDLFQATRAHKTQHKHIEQLGKKRKEIKN